MANAAVAPPLVPLAVEPAAVGCTGAAGSLVLRRMDRRGHKRGLVRAKKHGTKSGSGAPFRRDFFLAFRHIVSKPWYNRAPEGRVRT